MHGLGGASRSGTKWCSSDKITKMRSVTWFTSLPLTFAAKDGGFSVSADLCAVVISSRWYILEENNMI